MIKKFSTPLLWERRRAETVPLPRCTLSNAVPVCLSLQSGSIFPKYVSTTSMTPSLLLKFLLRILDLETDIRKGLNLDNTKLHLGAEAIAT